MRIEPIKAEPSQQDQSYQNTAEKAISIGFEDAMEDKGRECDYEFTIEERKGKKFIYCEVKLENGFHFTYQHPAGETPNLSELEREAYTFLLERL